MRLAAVSLASVSENRNRSEVFRGIPKTGSIPYECWISGLVGSESFRVSASTLRMASDVNPSQVPISDHQPPTKSGDNPPGSGDWGQESCRTWLANTPRIEVFMVMGLSSGKNT